MVSTIMSLIISTISVYLASYILPGVTVDNLTTTFLVAIVLGIINTFIKPILTLLTLPLTLITLGLFSLLLNALLVQLTSAIVPGFQIDGLFTAILFSIILSISNAFLNSLAK